MGPLFGRLVAEALDREWERCGRPDHFALVDAGAGPGTLARAVAAAEPRCRGVLDYIALERSGAQRERHPEWVRSTAEMPDGPITGMVLANELLDNLAFQPLLAVDGRWFDAAVDRVGERLQVVPGDPAVDGPDDVDQPGYIAQREVAGWIAKALAMVERGVVVMIDYARLASRDVEVRTYRGHERGDDPLVALGTQDITVDVDLEQLRARRLAPDKISTQTEWLEELGLPAMVDEGRELWARGAAEGGLEALAGRSRILEAEALCDPAGLGAFTVAQWVRR